VVGFLFNISYSHLIYRLIASTNHVTAHRLISDQRSNLSALSAQGPDAQRVAQAATVYLDYLVNTWMPEALWQSWSHHGRIIAAQLLNVPVEGVLPTTNHLESFNGLLKRKYLPQWQRSGTRLRVDFLILILITKILPEIFSLRRTLGEYKQWLKIRFSKESCGLDIDKLRQATRTPASSTSEPNLCWWPLDMNRQTEAEAIVRLKRIYDFRQEINLHQFEATCISSSASLDDPNHKRYYQYIHRDGYAACTCPDFTSKGAACKHLRALRLVLDNWVACGKITPFYYPPSAEAARNVRSFVSHSTHTSGTGAAVLQNFLALQNIAGKDVTATDEDEMQEDDADNDLDIDDQDENTTRILPVRSILTIIFCE
jgi:hypothetical protein